MALPQTGYVNHVLPPKLTMLTVQTAVPKSSSVLSSSQSSPATSVEMLDRPPPTFVPRPIRQFKGYHGRYDFANDNENDYCYEIRLDGCSLGQEMRQNSGESRGHHCLTGTVAVKAWSLD